MNLNNICVNQQKYTITGAKNFNICNKYKDHHNFWSADASLKDDGMSLGVYQTIQQKYDRSHLDLHEKLCFMPGQRQYIDSPEAILKEKGISDKPCMSTPQLNWDKSDNVTLKRDFLEEKLKLIGERKPDIFALSALGVPLLQSSSHSENTKSLEKDVRSTPNYSETQRSILIMVGEKEVEESAEPWIVSFKNCVVDKMYNIYLTIKNTKESSLRYSWSLESPPWVNCGWPVKYLKIQDRSFYFNRSDGVILPGCEDKVLVCFQSSKAGVFCQSWKMHFSYEPDQWNAKAMQLLAVAVERLDSATYTEAIDSYIESCTRYTIARKTVEEILNKSRTQRQELPYDWKFFEEQIFIHNNPDLFYDNKSVQILKNLHAKVSGGPWDYSVHNLRRKLLEKSFNEDCSQELEIFSSSIYELLKPNLPTCILNEKHKSVYELLRCFANKIDFEGANLTLLHKLPISLYYSEDFCKIQQKSSNEFKHSAKKSSLLSKTSRKTSNTKSNTYSIGVNDFVSKPHCCDSNSTSGLKIKSRKQEYLEALYIKTYHHLSQTVDQISAIIDSFNAQNGKTVLHHLKNQNV